MGVEEQALAKCNDDPVSKSVGVPCWLYSVGNQVVLPQRSTKPLSGRSPLGEALLKRLAAYAVPANESERGVRFFEVAAGAHKAIAVSPETHHAASSGGWVTSAAAEIGALESCQLLWGKPCALLAVDDIMLEQGNQGSPTVRDMPRTRYTGLFNPEQIPRTRPETVRRADVVGYHSAPEPKAAALDISGDLFIVTGAASQMGARRSRR
jgi:hypothetical protein